MNSTYIRTGTSSTPAGPSSVIHLGSKWEVPHGFTARLCYKVYLRFPVGLTYIFKAWDGDVVGNIMAAGEHTYEH